MNNNAYANTWFPVSAEDPATSSTIHLLGYAIYKNLDPIESWRINEGLELHDMPDILKCGPHEYQLHADGFGKEPFSPLTGRHVLNFCRYARIHPSDLINHAAYPNAACPPHIYKALQLVHEEGVYEQDQVYAARALAIDEMRYRIFLEERPDIAGHFRRLEGYAAANQVTVAEQRNMMREIRHLSNADLRKTLHGAFIRSSGKRYGSDPRNHADDLYDARQDLREDSYIPVAQQALKNINIKGSLREAVQFLYGKEQLSVVLRDMEKWVRQLSSAKEVSRDDIAEILHARLQAQYKICPEARDEMAHNKVLRLTPLDTFVGDVAGMYHEYSKRSDFNRQQLETLQESELQNLAFEIWAEQIEYPQFFYMQYLYCNQALSIPQSRSSTLETDTAQRFDLR